MSMPARKTFHGYAAATRWAPQWTTAYLVYQAGLPRTRGNSLTGGGQIYGHEFAPLFNPVIVQNAPGINALLAGGMLPAYPASLASLFGGARGQGS